MKKHSIANIVFGIVMVVILVLPFFVFSQMAEKKQSRETGSEVVISEEASVDSSSISETDTSAENSNGNMQFTWKTVLILSVGVLAAALRFRRMKQMREQG